MQRRSGLGKGLGALIPVGSGQMPTGGERPSPALAPAASFASETPVRDRSDISLVSQDVIYAGLDALQAAVPLDLCAYLHAADGAGPQLYLRSPDLSTMDAGECFDLFIALRDTLDAGNRGEAPLRVAGFDAVAITTTGANSTGLHVVGRRTTPLDPREHELAVRLSQALGAAAHALEVQQGVTAPLGPPSVRLQVQVGDGEARAEVFLPAGSELRRGHGRAWSPSEAVAGAVLDALGDGLELAHAGQSDAGGERVVLVVLQDRAGRRALGSALGGSDPLQATATATLEAAEQLRSGAPAPTAAGPSSAVTSGMAGPERAPDGRGDVTDRRQGPTQLRVPERRSSAAEGRE